MITFKNYTPHPLSIYDESGSQCLYSIDSFIKGGIRVSETTTRLRELELPEKTLVPVVIKKYGAVEGLPEKEKDTYLIVSLMVAQALRAQGVVRADILSPDTGPDSVVRDNEGHILGVRRFQIT